MWVLVTLLFLMVIVVIFSLQNAQPVEFSFLFGRSELSLALIITLSALIGAIAGIVAALSQHLTMRRRLAEAEGKTRKLKAEVAEMAGKLERQERFAVEEEERRIFDSGADEPHEES